MKSKDYSKSTEKVKKKKKQPLNKKQLNNKVLKAKEVLANNRDVLKKSALDPAQPVIPGWKRILLFIRRIFFWVLIVVLAAVILSFILVRARGGTPTVFGYSILRITTGSMEPTLMVGDIILGKEPSSVDEIDLDDIITFNGGSEFDYNHITHRVVVPPMKNSDGEYVLMTKGDANTTVDPEIYYSDIQSVMVRKLDFLNWFFAFFISPWGLIIFIAALLLIFFDELWTLVKVLTNNYDEEDEDENLSEIMSRIKREEEEQQRREEERREYKRRHPRKFDSTSARKKKNRKMQARKKG